MSKKANIALWGPDVSEIAMLVHALKTGEYVRHRESIHPFSEDIIFDNVPITATVPSANMGARLAWRSVLPDFDGIVYVVDAAELALSKDELHGLLNDETLSKPILILAPMSNTSSEEELRQQLNVQEVVTKGGQPVALFMYSVPLTKIEGAEEGFQWLLQHV
jgi:hypothetical protein